MRFALFAMLLGGCSGGTYDGSWLTTVQFKDDSCNPDNTSIGAETQLYASTYTTSAGSFVFEIGGLTMLGALDGKSFEVQVEQGVSIDGAGCDTMENTQIGELAGDFTEDGGLDGTLRSGERTLTAGCEDPDAEQDELCTLRYSVVGMRLYTASDKHPRDGMTSGSLPSGGGSYY